MYLVNLELVQITLPLRLTSETHARTQSPPLAQFLRARHFASVKWTDTEGKPIQVSLMENY